MIQSDKSGDSRSSSDRERLACARRDITEMSSLRTIAGGSPHADLPYAERSSEQPMKAVGAQALTRAFLYPVHHNPC